VDAEQIHLNTSIKSLCNGLLYEDRHPYAAGEQSYALFFEDPMRMKVELCAY